MIEHGITAGRRVAFGRRLLSTPLLVILVWCGMLCGQVDPVLGTPATAGEGRWVMVPSRPVAGDTLTTTVTYVTLEHIYLGVGSEVGLTANDTLRVQSRGGPWTRLIVEGVSSSRSVNRYAGQPQVRFAVDDVVHVLVATGEGRRTEVASPAPRVAVSPPGSILERPATMAEGRAPVVTSDRPIARRKRPAALSGRVRVGVSAIRTETLWLTDQPQSAIRTFTTPRISGRFVARNLPGGTKAVMQFDISHRSSSGTSLSPETLTRIRQTSLMRALPGSPFQFETGRFQFREDPGRTYWDGGRAGFASKRLDMGIAVGFEPDRFNGGVQTDLPKLGSFLRLKADKGTTRLATTIAAVTVRPSNGWIAHSYVGLEQSIRVSGFRLDGALQADQSPDGGLYLSKTQVRAVLPIGKRLSIRPRYSVRMPYAMWRVGNPVGTRREQQGLGVYWNGRAFSAHAATTVTHTGVNLRGTNLNGGLSLRRLPLIGLGVSLSGGSWSGNGSTARFATATLSRPLFGLRAQSSYSYYSVGGRAARTRSHTVSAGLSGSLSRFLDLSASVRSQFGQQTRSRSLYLSLGYRF